MIFVGTREEVERQRKALAAASGLPRRERVFRYGIEVTGDPRWDQSPAEYAGPGTSGWSDLSTSVMVSEDLTVAAIEITPDLERHLGTVVQVDGQPVTIRSGADIQTNDALPAKLVAVRTLA